MTTKDNNLEEAFAEAAKYLADARSILSSVDTSNIDAAIDNRYQFDYALASLMLTLEMTGNIINNPVYIGFWEDAEANGFDGSSASMEAASLSILKRAGRSKYPDIFTERYVGHSYYDKIAYYFSVFEQMWGNSAIAHYAAVGIWDVAFIEKCIADDIDVELALRTYNKGRS